MNALNGFNKIARFYDPLAAFVFGGQIMKAQMHLLDRLSNASNILILGGGTGRILQPLLTISQANIYYVEASRDMIHLSQGKVSNDPRVIFIHGTHLDVPIGVSFDAVVLSFFVDMFTEPELSGLINQLLMCGGPNCKWLVTDFVSDRAWHRMLLFFMYLFFKMCRVTPWKLPDWRGLFHASGLILNEHKPFAAGFISTNIYKVATPICQQNPLSDAGREDK